MFRSIFTPRYIFLFITLTAAISIIECVSTKFVPDENTEKWTAKKDYL